MTSPTTILENAPSFIGNMRSRLKDRTLLFRYLAEINIILGAWYIFWRFNHSINFNVLWISIPLILAELYSFIGGAMFTIGLWRPLEREVRSLDQLRPSLAVNDFPTVDIFITCYNEPVEMVEETAKAALNIEYPVNKLRVYILDDGKSDDMRAMSQMLAIEDLRSPQNQAEAARIENERAELETRLYQLQELLPNTKEADDFLQNVAESHPAVKFLLTLRDVFVIMNGKATTGISVSDRLLIEQKRLEKEIQQKERESSDLIRCRYIGRTKIKGQPHHAKAGNINHAIFSGETHGSFILTLDADHIPKPQFLKRVLPYFYSFNQWTGKYEGNRIAFVQTPQDFYNLPEGDPYGHSAHLFYGPIQQGKDGLNSAFYTGTNAILRREALLNVGLQYFSAALEQDSDRINEFNLIGGMSSSSITEDMNTAMRLHSAGWQSVYHNELLAEGLAPDDLVSTLKQRLRWAQGTIQVLLQENPLTKSGLSFWQRLQYFQTMYSYFSGFFTLIFICCPIIFFFTDIIPVSAYGADFAIHFFPAFVINRLTFLAATWGIPAGELWRSEQYAIALFPLFIQSVWSVFSGIPLSFQVTPKQRQSGNYLYLVVPQLTIIALTVVGMTWSLIRFMMGTLSDPWVHLLNSSWAIYNVCLLSVVVKAAVWQPKEESPKV
ncbi:cellulose synthase catalytic subunit [Pseudanabaena sp. lw0831]|uniref:glycosyltransferase family 2 protein n=1 Tax=Pseudanabaena sp. lw0831 TaxID=1357935 RepID=UPI001915FF61|nr:glycosyltransferase family 2 protein [Pseudanabaena sp. lw0831]GBO51747.1 cellulose synthase catalytic subunit [Pseudanabaena sp. lw0831]